MANRRMLGKAISTSIQVNKLCLPARLLFTWMIPHTDDEGRLKGEPAYIKATVVPMTNWSPKKIETYLNEMKDAGLIYYWEQKNEWFIEFVKWAQHQQIRKDRFTPSTLPSFIARDDNHSITTSQPSDNQGAAQANIGEYNAKEVNKSENNTSEYNQNAEIADKSSFKGTFQLINPKDFSPSNAEETAALEVWRDLEAQNPFALSTTYLAAVKRGLPADLFYVYRSEIRQDNTIKNPGAVFKKKVEDYFKAKRSEP